MYLLFIELIGYDNSPESNNAIQPITSVDQNGSFYIF